MVSLIAGSAAFFLIHAVVAGTSIRFWLVDKIGLKVYVPIFAIGSLGALWWMSGAYNNVSGAGLDPIWLTYPWGGYLTAIVMFPALILAVVGLMTKSPTAMEQGQLLEQDDIATGVLRITRHPFLVGVALWAATHLIVNSDPSSLVFFGTFLVVVLNGMRNIDRKRLHIHGGAWTKFSDQTSSVPFVAIIQGRNSLRLGEIGAAKLLAGVVVYLAVAGSHYWLFSVPTPLEPWFEPINKLLGS
jgi:uncharacterized membrane protein